jgi:hypothetical protein
MAASVWIMSRRGGPSWLATSRPRALTTPVVTDDPPSRPSGDPMATVGWPTARSAPSRAAPWQRLRPGHLHDGHVGGRVRPDQLGLERRAVGEDGHDPFGLVDHVGVGQHVAVVAEDHARPAPVDVTPHLDADDGRAGLRSDAHDGPTGAGPPDAGRQGRHGGDRLPHHRLPHLGLLCHHPGHHDGSDRQGRAHQPGRERREPAGPDAGAVPAGRPVPAPGTVELGGVAPDAVLQGQRGAETGSSNPSSPPPPRGP